MVELLPRLMSRNSLKALNRLAVADLKDPGPHWLAAAVRHIRAVEGERDRLIDASLAREIRKTRKTEYLVITLCGSMRFGKDVKDAAIRLSEEGWVVLAPFVTFIGEEQGSESKQMLDRMHFAKIDMSRAIFVVNPGGYIGESTRREIDYARKLGREIKSLVQIE